MTDLQRFRAELRAAVILAGKEIRKLNFERADSPVLAVLRRVPRKSRAVARQEGITTRVRLDLPTRGLNAGHAPRSVHAASPTSPFSLFFRATSAGDPPGRRSHASNIFPVSRVPGSRDSTTNWCSPGGR
jgi:hypothetical protein